MRYIKEDLTNALIIPDKSPAAQQAAQMGLVYVGFGRYEDPATGQVAYIVQNEKLVPFGKAIRTNSYQATNSDDFGNFIQYLQPQVEEDVAKLMNTYMPEDYSEEELDAIKQFTDTGYYNVNSLLNSLPPNIMTKQIQPTSLSDNSPQIIQALDTALARNKLPKEIVGYATLSSDVDSGSIAPNSMVLFKGYRSTTLDISTILNKFTEDGNGGGVVFQILMPKGSGGMYLDDFSSNPGESEYLLPRSSTIKIVSGPNKLSGTYQSPDNNLSIVFYSCELRSTPVLR